MYIVYVSYSGLITSFGEERDDSSAIDVVYVRRGFLYLLVLRIGYGILLWHSLGISYNYLVQHFVVLNETRNNVMIKQTDVFWHT